jgi:hypothetical protein
MTQAQEDAADQLRRMAVRKAIRNIYVGRPGYALFVMARSVEKQARIAGIKGCDLP